MQIIRAPSRLSNTKLKSCDDIIKKLSEHKCTVEIRPHSIYKKLGTHPIFIDFAESNQALCKQLRSYYDGTYYPPLEYKDTYIKKRINSLIKEDPIEYRGPIDRNENNLLEYLSNLLLYKALLLDIMEQLKDDLGNNKDLKQTCAHLDYKLSIHIRFTRSMSALNAYTKEKLTSQILSMYRTPYHETGAQDMFCRMIIKRANLMKLERYQINRYVTVQDGLIYTTVADPPKHERTKFAASPETTTKTTTPDRDKSPVWDYSAHKNDDDYKLEQRIKDSCDNFNKQIDKSVISTYANYYGVNNVLEVAKVENERSKSYLEYEYENTKRGLSIPIYMKSQPVTTTKAPLHVLLTRYKDEMFNPTNLPYQPYPAHKRPVTDGTIYDIYGLLYAIRKGEIAVQRNDDKAGFHSSMWSGKAVQAAGILCSWNGKIIAVDNSSGHYKPNWYLLYKAWKPFYDKDVFHDQGMLGIWTRFINKNWPDCFDTTFEDSIMMCQYFKAEKFMELADNDFQIGPTVTELVNHLDELGGMREIKVDTDNKEECKDVIKSPYMTALHSIWNDSGKSKALACEFIRSMEYDWEEIIKNVKKSYNNFPAKKTTWSGLRSRFNVIPNDNRVENILKRRTKRLRKDIKNRHKKNNYYYVSGMDEINQKNIPLIQLIDAYKKIGFELIPKIPWENEFVKEIEDFRKEQKEKIKEEPKTVEWAAYEQSKLEEKRNKFDQIISSNDVLKEKWRIKVNKYMIEKIGIGLLFKLIKCMVDIDSANEAFSSFKNVLNNVEKGRIENWSKNIKKALEVPANKRAGLDTSKDVILLNAAEQKNKAEEYIKTPDIVCSECRDIAIDNLSNLRLTDEDTTIVKNKLRLVDKRIYEQQPPKKSQSTTAKEGVWLYCVRCERGFDPTVRRPPGEPKLAVGSNCPNCKEYSLLKQKNL